MWPMLSTLSGLSMTEPYVLYTANALVAWSVRWQIASLFAGMVLISQANPVQEGMGLPSTLVGLIIAISMGMLAILTWTVKELLRINEKHANVARIMASRIPHNTEEVEADERKVDHGN